ncbi:MarR family winged helix-turn-helix transcriptional regulator [Sphingomonas sp. CFBP 8760]|uniref:MarR family winged helix-turn-helix transcriptional regulator n=1 Tax=Sphingomonas sp. CFBP 8760 TaxID=2775282 RepID=UPI00177FA6C7|nr:MarR family winged helix-turn-helix transcriptional regulator [Sphingomonas sp. CFBP 8760]MBD8545874.1 winged helix-turn-helix transcriptional regulator [Sphingomonas sp. CFBP 8760]
MARRPLILDDFIPYRLSVTSNLVSDTIARTYEALFGLTIPEWRLVAVIAERDGITQQAIGATTRMDKVTVSRAAIALADRGLLARVANPDDRRSHLLRLTGPGHKLYAAVAPQAIALERRIFAGFAPAEIAAFTAMLRRIEAAALALDATGDAP